MAEQGGVSQEPGTPEGVPIGRAPEIVGPPPIPETPEKTSTQPEIVPKEKTEDVTQELVTNVVESAAVSDKKMADRAQTAPEGVQDPKEVRRAEEVIRFTQSGRQDAPQTLEQLVSQIIDAP